VLISAAILAVIPASGLQAADAPGVAQSACFEAVNNQYGGSVKTVDVASIEFSQANSVVVVRAIGIRGSKQSETWKCLVSNRGVV